MAAIARSVICGLVIAYLVSVASYSRIPEPFCCRLQCALARALIAFRAADTIAFVIGFSPTCGSAIPSAIVDAHIEATYWAIIRSESWSYPRRAPRGAVALTSKLQPDVVKGVAHAVPVMLGLALIVNR